MLRSEGCWILIGVLLSGRLAAQGAGAEVRGRVVGGDGAPLAGVRVIARAPTLTLDRETQSAEDGGYAITNVPPGDYVISFERDGFVTVRHATRITGLETAIADAVLREAPDTGDLITAIVDPDQLPLEPSASASVDAATLARLPVEGGLSTVLARAPGPLAESGGTARVTIDGAPVRFSEFGGRPLLDPGPAALDQATLVYAGAPADQSGFGSGVVAVATRAGRDRLSGEARLTLGDADRVADTITEAGGTRATATDLSASAGLPLAGRRTWLVGSMRRWRDPVSTYADARRSPAAFAATIAGGFLQVKGTHAFTAGHRLEAEFLRGDESSRGVPPPGAVVVDAGSALANRTADHRLFVASYDGVVAGAWQAAARLWREARTDGGPTGPGADAPTTFDARTGAAIGGAGAHLVTIGASRASGRLLAGASAGAQLASRVEVEDGAIAPVFAPDGSSWIVGASPGAAFEHQEDGGFAEDDWRAGSRLTVNAGLRWDRQRLRTPDARPPVARTALSPRVHASWQPTASDLWTVSGGFAHYEASVLDLFGGGVPPAGDWYAIGTNRARFTGAEAPWAALVGRSAARFAPTIEWTAGAAGRLGRPIQLRADVIWRRSRPLTLSGLGVDPLDATAFAFERPARVDLGLLTRRYLGLVVQGEFRMVRVDVIGRYTVAREWGESRGPEPAEAASAAPPGDLPHDRPLRLDVGGHVFLFDDDDHGTLDVAGIETLRAGVPLAVAAWTAVTASDGTVALRPSFELPRDRVRAETATRLDGAVSYSRLIPGALRSRIFVQVQVLNILDERHARYPETLVGPAALDLSSALQTMPRAWRVAVGTRF
jgi:hypothetical protein